MGEKLLIVGVYWAVEVNAAAERSTGPQGTGRSLTERIAKNRRGL